MFYEQDSRYIVENFLQLSVNSLCLYCIFVDALKYKAMQTEVTLQEEIEALRSQLTGDMFSDMDIKDQIHNLEMKLKGVKPMDSHIDCIGCGA